MNLSASSLVRSSSLGKAQWRFAARISAIDRLVLSQMLSSSGAAATIASIIVAAAICGSHAPGASKTLQGRGWVPRARGRHVR